jgi:prepilin-type N-terminal cleavage/methylation domain-containing protein
MKIKTRQHGLTLIEMTVVILVVALMTSLSIPAVRTFFGSMVFSEGAESMISAALATGRAIAAKEQRYAGVRFQTAYHPDGLLNSPQYMIFVVHEEPRKMGNLTIGFRAVDGVKPIKLPDSVGVMDLRIDGNTAVDDVSLTNLTNLTDTKSFSIVFSPSGKLVIHDVRVRNRHGIPDSTGRIGDSSTDDMFNKKVEVDLAQAMFYQDDYFGATWSPYFPDDYGLGPEPSRSCFVIYDKERFIQVNVNRRWTDYLSSLEMIYINPYTGRMISQD